MKLTNRWCAGLALGLLPALAFALPVTLNAPSSSFSDAVGGKHVVYTPAGNHSEVRWGSPTKNNPKKKSGLGFDVFNAPLSTQTGATFGLGTLTHFNWEIKSGTAAKGVSLDFAFTITTPQIGDVNFLFPLAIEETTNRKPCEETPVPKKNYCPDIITFTSATSSQSFSIGGVDYTLFILGFGPDANHITNRFITQEGRENTTQLWAKIDARNPPVDVPEPNGLALMALGLLALGGGLQLRRKQNKA